MHRGEHSAGLRDDGVLVHRCHGADGIEVDADGPFVAGATVALTEGLTKPAFSLPQQPWRRFDGSSKRRFRTKAAEELDLPKESNAPIPRTWRDS